MLRPRNVGRRPTSHPWPASGTALCLGWPHRKAGLLTRLAVSSLRDPPQALLRSGPAQRLPLSCVPGVMAVLAAFLEARPGSVDVTDSGNF